MKPIFLSRNLNSLVIVAKNLFQNFVLLAIKTHVYYADLKRHDLALIRPSFYFGAIEVAADFAQGIVESLNMSSKLPVKWLCMCAFKLALERKSEFHQEEFFALLTECENKTRPSRPWLLPFPDILASGEDLVNNIVY